MTAYYSIIKLFFLNKKVMKLNMTKSVMFTAENKSESLTLRRILGV